MCTPEVPQKQVLASHQLAWGILNMQDSSTWAGFTARHRLCHRRDLAAVHIQSGGRRTAAGPGAAPAGWTPRRPDSRWGPCGCAPAHAARSLNRRRPSPPRRPPPGAAAAAAAVRRVWQSHSLQAPPRPYVCQSRCSQRPCTPHQHLSSDMNNGSTLSDWKHAVTSNIRASCTWSIGGITRAATIKGRTWRLAGSLACSCCAAAGAAPAPCSPRPAAAQG